MLATETMLPTRRDGEHRVLHPERGAHGFVCGILKGTPASIR
jgi:hypothetical protein